jgi:hypothetical protein
MDGGLDRPLLLPCVRESLGMLRSDPFLVFALAMNVVSGHGTFDPLDLHEQLTRCTREFLIELIHVREMNWSKQN